MKFSNKTYDILKRVALYILPALATLVITLGEVWKIDYSVEVGATITALDTFLGACLGISSKNYYEESEE